MALELKHQLFTQQRAKTEPLHSIATQFPDGLVFHICIFKHMYYRNTLA